MVGEELFMGLAYAVDRALGVPKGRPLVHNMLLAFVMLPVTGILLMIAIATTGRANANVQYRRISAIRDA